MPLESRNTRSPPRRCRRRGDRNARNRSVEQPIVQALVAARNARSTVYRGDRCRPHEHHAAPRARRAGSDSGDAESHACSYAPGMYRGLTTVGNANENSPSCSATISTYEMEISIVAPGSMFAIDCVKMFGRSCSSRPRHAIALLGLLVDSPRLLAFLDLADDDAITDRHGHAVHAGPVADGKV